MTDLVKRLRGEGCGKRKIAETVRLMDEAADEIERLRDQRDHNAAVALSAKKAVIEDMREWAHENQEKLKGDGPQRIICAYAKDRGY